MVLLNAAELSSELYAILHRKVMGKNKNFFLPHEFQNPVKTGPETGIGGRCTYVPFIGAPSG